MILQVDDALLVDVFESCYLGTNHKIIMRKLPHEQKQYTLYVLMCDRGEGRESSVCWSRKEKTKHHGKGKF